LAGPRGYRLKDHQGVPRQGETPQRVAHAADIVKRFTACRYYRDVLKAKDVERRIDDGNPAVKPKVDSDG
jgi:hypothetical protein